MYIPKEMRDIGLIPPLFPLTNMTSNTHTPSPCAPREKKNDKDTSSICFYQVTSFPRGVWRVHHPVINTTGGGPQQMQNPTLVTRYR